MKNIKNRIAQDGRQRQRMTAKTIVIVSTCAFLLIASGFFAYFNLSNVMKTSAAANGDYRSAGSGLWSAPGTWEKFNGLIWTTPLSAPTSANNVITIQSGHVVTINANVTVDQVVVNSGGEVDLASGITLTVANGAGNDFDVSGIFKNAGTVSSSGAVLAFQSGGKYQHDYTTTNGTIPTATWATGSICELTGYTTNTSIPGGISQTFSNFSWNCPNQTGSFDLIASLLNIAGDLTIANTGTGNIQLDKQGNNNVLTINGNLNVTGGTFYACTNGATVINVTGNYVQTGGNFNYNRAGGTAYGNTSLVMTINGNMTISGGVYDMSQYDGNNSSKGNGTLNLYGNLSLSGSGKLTESSVYSRGKVYISNTSAIQTFTSSGNVTQKVDFIVLTGAIFRMDAQVLTGDGTFTLNSGGGLMLGSVDGISASGATGNVQSTDVRSFSTGGDYTYNGTAAQITGNGLPATVHNLTISNSSNVTLTSSCAASNLITLTSGKVITNANELGITNTSTTSIAGYSISSYVIGNLRRTVAGSGTYAFPLGTLNYYEASSLTLTAAAGFTTMLGYFTKANPVDPSYPLSNVTVNGTLIDDMLDYGYWTFTPNSAMSGGSYTVSLSENGASNSIDNPQSYTVLKRANAASPWASAGTHVNTTQSINGGTITAVRSSLTGFSHFGIGKHSGGGSLPVELLFFHAKLNERIVRLDWATSSEINNNFFTVERSIDGEHFEKLLDKGGSGNTTATHYYDSFDTHPLAGRSYYRLKQTDFDGHFTYSEVVTIQIEDIELNSQNFFEIKSISPNPFNSNFKIVFKTKGTGEIDFALTGISGENMTHEKIKTTEGYNTYDFTDYRNLKKGVYLLIMTCNEQKLIRKIIKY